MPKTHQIARVLGHSNLTPTWPAGNSGAIHPTLIALLQQFQSSLVLRKGTGWYGWYLHHPAFLGSGNLLVSPVLTFKFLGVLLPCYNDKPSFHGRQRSKFLRDFQSWGSPFDYMMQSFPTNRNVQRIGGSHTAVWSFNSILYTVATIQVDIWTSCGRTVLHYQPLGLFQ